MKCEVILKNDKTIYVDDFNCIEYTDGYDAETKLFENKDFGGLDLLDDVTYTIIGSSIIKVKGEQILYLQFKK